MLKLTKTGIGLLTRQYRSVLKKCLLINLGLFVFNVIMFQPALGSIIVSSNTNTGNGGAVASSNGIAIGGVDTVSMADKSIVIGDYALAGGGPDIQNRFNNIGVGGFDVTGLVGSSYAIAIGSYSGASGAYSTAVGHRAYAIGEESSVLGNHANAYANYSVVLGSSSTTSEDYVVSVGHKGSDISWGGTTWGTDLFRRIVNVMEGSDANDAVTVSQLGSIAAGTKILNPNGTSAISFGTNTNTGQITVGTAIARIANELDNNYYRKNKKSGILNGFEEGEIGNKIGDNFSKLAANDNFATNNGDFASNNDSFLTNNDNFASKNGDFASKNPSRLGAFSKCEKACSRPLERFPASLEKNSAFEQYSRSARGTFLFGFQPNKNVLDNFYKNSQCLKASNDNFAITTFLRAI